jgi:hypothetical protein
VLATLGISVVLSLHAHPVEDQAERVAPVRPALGVHVEFTVDAAAGHLNNLCCPFVSFQYRIDAPYALACRRFQTTRTGQIEQPL